MILLLGPESVAIFKDFTPGAEGPEALRDSGTEDWVDSTGLSGRLGKHDYKEGKRPPVSIEHLIGSTPYKEPLSSDQCAPRCWGY